MNIDGTPMIVVGRSGENVGANDIYIWKRKSTVAIYREVAQATLAQRGQIVLWVFAVFFVLENIMVSSTPQQS